MHKNTSAIALAMAALGMKPRPEHQRKAYKKRGPSRPQVRKPNFIKNPKIAAHVNMMHQKWVTQYGKGE